MDRARNRAPGEPVRVQIAAEQRDLEEEEADVPDERGASERREQQLRDDRLDQKQEPGADEQAEREEGSKVLQSLSAQNSFCDLRQVSTDGPEKRFAAAFSRERSLAP